MSDPELEAIRAQRLAQLQSQFSASGDSSANPDKLKAQEEQIRAQNEARNSILSQILDQSARARLNTLALGKPEKAKMVEQMLIQMAQTGQIRGKITEENFIGILESVNAQMPSTKTTVKYDRRRAALDSDDDDF